MFGALCSYCSNAFVGLMTAGASKDKDTQEAVVGYLRTISVSSSKLLLAAKALSADPNAPNVMNQLAAAARYVGNSITAAHSSRVAAHGYGTVSDWMRYERDVCSTYIDCAC